MSQAFTRPLIRQFHHILIIDDSARLRYTLAELIVANCLAAGKIYRVFHSDKNGKFTQSNEVPPPGLLLLGDNGPSESKSLDEFAIYTAPSPKHALFVINSPLFSRLTIISDVMMPADTEVGLIGMLEALARRKLPVNLVFASTDAQNNFVVAKLVEARKAYFVVKQGSAWEDLSRALVQRTDNFRFKTITTLDFEGMQKLPGLVDRKTPEPEPEPNIAEGIIPDFGSYLPKPPTPQTKIKPVQPLFPPVNAEPAPVQSPIFQAEPGRPQAQFNTPKPEPAPIQAQFSKPEPALEQVPLPKIKLTQAQTQFFADEEPDQTPAQFLQTEAAPPVTSRQRADMAPPMPTWEDLIAPNSKNTAEPVYTEEELTSPKTERAALAWEDLISPRTKQLDVEPATYSLSVQPAVSQNGFKKPPLSGLSARLAARPSRPVAPPKRAFPLFRPFVSLLNALKRFLYAKT